MDGVYGIISDITKTSVENNVLSGLTNLSLGNNSTFVIKNNIVNTDTGLNTYSLHNSKIFIDDFNIKYKTNKSCLNSFFNFPNLTIDINNIDNIDITNNTTNSFIANDYYINEKVSYNKTVDTQILSPKFLNNGSINYWGTNKNQRLFYNIEYKVTPSNVSSFINDILPNIPRNLNGNNLNITLDESFKCTNDTPIINFDNFFGGQINISGTTDIIFSHDVLNITDEELAENGGTKRCYCKFNFNNCNSVNIKNIIFNYKC